jgi:hypothetical protein
LSLTGSISRFSHSAKDHARRVAPGVHTLLAINFYLNYPPVKKIAIRGFSNERMRCINNKTLFDNI